MIEKIEARIKKFKRERIINGKRYTWEERYIHVYVPKDIFKDIEEVMIVPKGKKG